MAKEQEEKNKSKKDKIQGKEAGDVADKTKGTESMAEVAKGSEDDDGVKDRKVKSKNHKKEKAKGKKSKKKGDASLSEKEAEKEISTQSLAETTQSVQAIVEANNKDWDNKFQKTVGEYESQMSQTEKKFKSDLQARNK